MPARVCGQPEQTWNGDAGSVAVSCDAGGEGVGVRWRPVIFTSRAYHGTDEPETDARQKRRHKRLKRHCRPAAALRGGRRAEQRSIAHAPANFAPVGGDWNRSAPSLHARPARQKVGFSVSLCASCPAAPDARNRSRQRGEPVGCRRVDTASANTVTAVAQLARRSPLTRHEWRPARRSGAITSSR